MSEVDLFSPFLAEMSASRKVTDHAKITEALLRYAAENSITLEQCSSSRIMDRKINTLKRYVRRFGLQFPDYISRKLRPKKPPKPRVRKKRVKKSDA